MRMDQPQAFDDQLRKCALTEINLLSLRAFLSMSSQSIVSTFLRGKPFGQHLAMYSTTVS